MDCLTLAAVGLMPFCDHTCVASVMEFGDDSHCTMFFTRWSDCTGEFSYWFVRTHESGWQKWVSLEDYVMMRHRRNFSRYLVGRDLKHLKMRIDNGWHIWIPRIP